MIDYEKYIFTTPGEWNTNCVFSLEAHQWHVFNHCDISKDDEFIAVAIAVCKKCAQITGGYLK